MKVQWKDVIIFGLILVIIVTLIFQKTSSYFTSTEVGKVKELLAKGRKDIDIAAELVQAGTSPDDALKAIAEAKGSPAKITN